MKRLFACAAAVCIAGGMVLSAFGADAYIESSGAQAASGDQFQFERTGYFVADAKDSAPGAPVFNRTVTLKDGYKPA